MGVVGGWMTKGAHMGSWLFSCSRRRSWYTSYTTSFPSTRLVLCTRVLPRVKQLQNILCALTYRRDCLFFVRVCRCDVSPSSPKRVYLFSPVQPTLSPGRFVVRSFPNLCVDPALNRQYPWSLFRPAAPVATFFPSNNGALGLLHLFMYCIT